MERVLLGLVCFLPACASLVAKDASCKNCTSLKEVQCLVFPRHSSRPHIKLKESTSTNWSGYAAATSLSSPAKNSVSYVVGTWRVPELKATSSTAYSSIWVGIDGYTSSSVEQIGTEHDFSSGKQQNYAWFEMYPQGSYEIRGFPINVGDQITGEVKYEGNGQFKLKLSNLTQKVSYVVPSHYTRNAKAARSSAEWIVEAPFMRQVLPLADFVSVSLTNCKATISGKTGSISDSHWNDDALKMATSQGVTKAEPSQLTNSGQNFTVTWDHQ